jgi:hypothetical protein
VLVLGAVPITFVTITRIAEAIGAPLVLAFGLSPWIVMLYELFDVAVTRSSSNLGSSDKTLASSSGFLHWVGSFSISL